MSLDYNGSTSLVAGLSSAQASSKIDGSGIFVGFQDYARSCRGPFAGVASEIRSDASGIWGTLNSSDLASASVLDITARAFEYYNKGWVYGERDVFRTFAYGNNTVGDKIQMYNSINGSTDPSRITGSINRTVTSGPTSVQGKETVEFNAKAFKNQANAMNFRGYYAETNVSNITTTMTHAKFTDTVTASSTAVSAAQSNFDAEGSLSAGGFATQPTGTPYASSLATIIDAALKSSSSSFGTDVYGAATASQKITADGEDVYLNWSSRNAVGDRVIGRTWINSTFSSALNNLNAYAKAVDRGTLSATGSLDGQINASRFNSTILSKNARNDYATVALMDQSGVGARARYKQAATATRTTATASQTLTYGVGSLEVYAGALQFKGSDSANHAATADGIVLNGAIITSSSTATSSTSGATASQTLHSDIFDSISNVATAGRGPRVSREDFEKPN